MATATWNGTIIAQSDKTIVVEGNHYFPPESLVRELISDSDKTTRCPWKGEANYYHVTVDGKRNDDAAWYYADPKSAAAEIKDHIAFWRGITVQS